MVAVSWFRQVRSSQFTDAKLRAELPAFERSHGQLMKVTAAGAIAGTDARWLYSVVKQTVQTSAASYVPTAAADTIVYSALSVSELSNGVNPYSYGVTKANIPAGFAAVKIPTGTWVWCVPHRMTDGTFIWLIVNTQAIDGACT